jgi:uncharacterized damage-inducible protein DinB
MQQVKETVQANYPVINSAVLLDQWQAQRRLTRKTIAAFPEDQLLNYSVGGMRPFADMVIELIGLAHHGINGIVSGHWANISEDKNHGLPANARAKAELLRLWDELTAHLNKEWPKISGSKFQEVDKAFGMYENANYETILYFIHNEIHHRAQGFVYLRALGIEPPFFWDTE